LPPQSREDVGDAEVDVVDIEAELVNVETELIDVEAGVVDIEAEVVDVEAELVDVKAEPVVEVNVLVLVFNTDVGVARFVGRTRWSYRNVLKVLQYALVAGARCHGLSQ
jgi:hypothetical protein